MGDLFSKNNNLVVMRHNHAKLIALANIQAKEIRIIELHEEVDRCKNDIEAQKKVIEEAERNITIHSEPIKDN